MTRTRIARRLPALTAAAVLASLALAPAAAAADTAAAPTLAEALAALPVADESRTGYDRDLFRHWVDEDGDGCRTRQEVLIAEAVTAPAVDEDCKVTGGTWYSYYDETTVEGPAKLDIDHLVPLAEAWDSGASAWTPERREAYANDLGDEIPLIAVTARSNRSKADQDPAQWMPPSQGAACRYVHEWVSVKTRWGLAVDAAEAEALGAIVSACPDAVVTIAPA
ncbi:HNH endonuclease family protein [Glycomyces sp. NPDC047369]